MGCDTISIENIKSRIGFNPRTPGGVRPLLAGVTFMAPWGFNPRTPGGVRLYKPNNSALGFCFNPRTPGGVRRLNEEIIFKAVEVSIHAPRVGCDDKGTVKRIESLFQSTHPGWGATIILTVSGKLVEVSIHAPRVGCDSIKRKGLKVRVICGTFCERIGVDFL